MTQTYSAPIQIAMMRQGLCPECGLKPEDHSDSPLFWLRDPLKCNLLPRGVTDRIAKQAEIDREATS